MSRLEQLCCRKIPNLIRHYDLLICNALHRTMTLQYIVYRQGYIHVIYHSSLVKGAMNAARLCKLRNDVKKCLNFFYFQWQKVNQVCSEYLRSYLNWLHNWQMKSTRRSHTLKGSQSKGDGRILLKPQRDDSFKKVLSNEPNFGRIHLAGQYL